VKHDDADDIATDVTAETVEEALVQVDRGRGYGVLVEGAVDLLVATPVGVVVDP
jgi:hypothetical protein